MIAVVDIFGIWIDVNGDNNGYTPFFQPLYEFKTSMMVSKADEALGYENSIIN